MKNRATCQHCERAIFWTLTRSAWVHSDSGQIDCGTKATPKPGSER